MTSPTSADRPTDLDARHARLCAAPAVYAAAVQALRKAGVPSQDLEDCAQSVIGELLESPHRPVDEHACEALATTIAKRRALDARKKTAVRAKRHAGGSDEVEACGDRPASGPEGSEADLGRSLDLRRCLDEARQVLQAEGFTEIDAQIVELEVAERSVAEIGQAVGWPETRVKNRRAKILARLRKALEEKGYVAAAVLALALMLGALLWDKLKTEAHPHDPEPTPAPAPAPAPVAPVDADGLARAEALRKDAEITCASARFAECAAALDEAARLDPASESRSDVQRLRAVVARGPRSGSDGKPTTRAPR